MPMTEMPKITAVPGGKIWIHTFEKFKATVYVPENEMMDDVLNYGFIAPYLLVFAEQDFSTQQENRPHLQSFLIRNKNV